MDLAFDQRLALVRSRMAEACARAHRTEDSVRLLAVTKQRPLADLAEAHRAGLRMFGENRVAEALEKQAAFSDVEWHMIGHLQTNKAKDCLGFTWLHSLDRPEAAAALEKAFAKAGTSLQVLLEANTGGEDQKDGCPDVDSLARLAEFVSSQCPHLAVRGLMTMAPFSPDEAVVRPCFVRLRTWRDQLAQRFPDQRWDELSMGMTNDLGWAIEEGATIVRVGTALFEGFR